MAEKLRGAPAKLYEFDRASLRDVLRFLADDAGIPFVALQESKAAESTLVTFTLKSSPFLALETVAKSNGVSLYYENGVWFMRPINEKELIGRIYKLKYNSQEYVKYQGGDSGSGATTSASSGGGSTGSGVPQMNVNIQGAAEVFKVEDPKIIDEIKSLLGIPTSSASAQMAGEASVGNFDGLNAPSVLSPAGSLLSGAPAGAAGANGAGGPQVIFNSDSGTIYVVATRQQHQWVEGFLSAVDRPQALIGIEVKFFETTKDPSKELGINWAGTLQGGYNVGIQDITASPNGSININTTSTTAGGTNSTGTNGSIGGIGVGGVTLGNATITAAAPYSAVLTAGDVNVAIQAFLDDRDTTTVQYPRVLTINNREVVIRSVINQPVLAATSSVTPGVGGTQTASVSYLPIGTIINVLPKTMPDNSVVLNVAITISSIVGEQVIQGNSYPIASSRVYNAALQVDSGYTLAVGGLEQAFDQSNRNGIPFLRDIPGVGELFKSKSKARSKRNLIIFITPTIINNRMASPGIPEVPQSIIPVRPNEPLPPAFTPNGRLVGGFASIDEAGRWLERQILYYRQVVVESRVDRDSLKQLNGVINTAEMLVAEIQLLEDSSPGKLDELIRKEERALGIVGDLNKIYSKSKKELMSY